MPTQKEAKQRLSNTHNIDETRPLLLTVGRLVERKGHTWFLQDVLPKVKTAVQYLIIGEGPQQESVEQMSEFIHNETSHQVIVMGRQEEDVVHHAYAAADAFIMPNIRVEGDMEGFGIVLLEANAVGCPAIATYIEGIRDVIEEGVNGYAIQEGDATTFAQSIDQLLSDSNTLATLRMSSKKRAETFEWQVLVKEYEAIFHSTLKK